MQNGINEIIDKSVIGILSENINDLYAFLSLLKNKNISLIFIRDKVFLNNEFYNQYNISHIFTDNKISDLGNNNSEEKQFIGIMTSGTTGVPKIVKHTYKSLLGKIKPQQDAVWSCSYQLGTFASIQVILSAVVGNQKIYDIYNKDLNEVINIFKDNKITHASGTPSFWRSVCQVYGNKKNDLSLKYITLGGETVDDTLLNILKQTFPGVKITHIYASTELGSILSVTDGKAGFPAEWLDTDKGGVILQIRDNVLWIKSNRSMQGYMNNNKVIFDENDFFCTEDLVEIKDNRVMFLGRGKGIINIGGAKVSAEMVEEKINQCEYVSDCLVYGVENPIVGYILGVEIVGNNQEEITKYINNNLQGVYLPRVIDFVNQIKYNEAGKKIRK